MTDLAGTVLAHAITAAVLPETHRPDDVVAEIADMVRSTPSALLESRVRLGHLIEGERDHTVRLTYAVAALLLDRARQERDALGTAEDLALAHEVAGWQAPEG